MNKSYGGVDWNTIRWDRKREQTHYQLCFDQFVLRISKMWRTMASWPYGRPSYLDRANIVRFHENMKTGLGGNRIWTWSVSWPRKVQSNQNNIRSCCGQSGAIYLLHNWYKPWLSIKIQMIVENSDEITKIIVWTIGVKIQIQLSKQPNIPALESNPWKFRRSPREVNIWSSLLGLRYHRARTRPGFVSGVFILFCLPPQMFFWSRWWKFTIRKMYNMPISRDKNNCKLHTCLEQNKRKYSKI